MHALCAGAAVMLWLLIGEETPPSQRALLMYSKSLVPYIDTCPSRPVNKSALFA